MKENNINSQIWATKYNRTRAALKYNRTWRPLSCLSFQHLNVIYPGKTVRDKCDHSGWRALLQMWWLHTTMQHNCKWHSWVRIISRMNAFFRSNYSDVPMCTQQTHPTTNGGIWRKGGGVLSLSWHDKSVCISTPFITSLPRQWIEFQKPINKGDVHSAWQLSQGNVPLSFAPPTPSIPASFFSFPCFWNK